MVGVWGSRWEVSIVALHSMKRVAALYNIALSHTTLSVVFITMLPTS